MERIAHALGVTMGEFFRATEEGQSSVVRADERTGLSSEWSQARIEALGAGRRLEGVLITIKPGGSSGKHPRAIQQEQLAVVIAGRLELTLGEEELNLLPGDAVTIRALVPRRWRNLSERSAQVLIVSTF